MSPRITQIYYSPGGSTASIARAVSSRLSEDIDTVDLLRRVTLEETLYSRDEAVVVALPVFAGRLPAGVPEMLERHRGQQTPAVAVVVYGNRHYDDALLELVRLLRKNGFAVIGAAAFVARHSIFPRVAQGRPDEEDHRLIAQFADDCARRLREGRIPRISVRGRPLRPLSTPPMAVTPSADGRCTGCGHCASLCPAKAIDPDRPRRTDRSRCISCTACIWNCPVKARHFRGPVYKAASRRFRKKCAVRQEPKVYT